MNTLLPSQACSQSFLLATILGAIAGATTALFGYAPGWFRIGTEGLAGAALGAGDRPHLLGAYRSAILSFLADSSLFPRKAGVALCQDSQGSRLVTIQIWKCRDPRSVRLYSGGACPKWTELSATRTVGLNCQGAEMALIEQLVAHAKGKQQLRRSKNKRLRQAVHRHKADHPQGIQERLFTLAFSGLVYPQIWEDPVVDLEALSPQGGRASRRHRVGRLQRAELSRRGADLRITAIDLNPAHVALNKLKLAALGHLPDYAAFRTFFADANARAEHRGLLRPICGRISTQHARRTGNRATASAAGASATSAPTSIATACSATSSARAICWRACTARTRADCSPPRRLERAATHLRERAGAAVPASGTSAGCSTSRRPCSVSAFRRRSSPRLRATRRAWRTCCMARLERLACDFDLTDNYFAWQAFGRRYASGRRRAAAALPAARELRQLALAGR